MGVIFCREVSKSSNEENIEERLGDRGAPSQIKYTKDNFTNTEEYKIDVTFKNVQKMKCELKGTVDMKIKVGETVTLNVILYIRQDVKNMLII